MSKSQHKKARKEEALRKRKQKKILIISICIVVVAAIATLVIFNAIKQSGSRVFVSDNNNTVTLNSDGTFSARLPHGVSFDGTFTEINEGDMTRITFTYQNISADGTILNDVLEVPHEWEDDHGHGSEYRLR